MFAAVPCVLLLSGQIQAGTSGSQVPTDGSPLQVFERQIAEVVRIHRDIEAQLGGPQPPASEAEEISEHHKELARRIMEARKQVRQGNVFTPRVADEFRRLISAVMRGPQGSLVLNTLASAEPVLIEVTANRPYPPGVPLQSMPPALLAALPKLPPELEYRIVGNALILRNVAARLVIDFIPNVVNQR
jgi:hypothetical protein